MRTLVPFLALAAIAFGCGNSETETADDDLTAKALKIFDCNTEKSDSMAPNRIQFAIKNIDDKKKLELLAPDGKVDEDSPVRVTPEASQLWAVNENVTFGLTYSRAKKEAPNSRLRISGASDTSISVELVLFRDTGFRSGYVNLKDISTGYTEYSKVTCTVTSK